jgi:hypothetical protein
LEKLSATDPRDSQVRAQNLLLELGVLQEDVMEIGKRNQETDTRRTRRFAKPAWFIGS